MRETPRWAFMRKKRTVEPIRRNEVTEAGHKRRSTTEDNEEKVQAELSVTNIRPRVSWADIVSHETPSLPEEATI